VKPEVATIFNDMAREFVDVWKRAEAGENVRPACVLSFESWDGLASVMTGERYRLLLHLHTHPEPSVSALARAGASPTAGSGGRQSAGERWPD
jgi:predicted transcriptional regulator